MKGHLLIRPTAKSLAVLLLMALVRVGIGAPTRQPVIVFANGDDGLTQRLQIETEHAFRASSDFTLSRFGTDANLVVVRIPTNVSWEKANSKTRISYTVRVSNRSETNARTVTGSCWDVEIAKCADHIVVQTRKEMNTF